MAEKKILSTLLQSRIVLLVLCLVTIISVVRLANEIARRKKISDEINRLKAQTLQLRAERDNLTSLVRYLGTNAYIEDQARKKLNLGNPGEKLVVIDDQNAIGNSTAANFSRPVTNVDRWVNYFFIYD